MANFRKIQIPTAVDGMYDHNLDFVHLTTQDYFGIRVLRAIEVAPKADINIDLSITGKCEPLNFPTYANVSTKVNAFFVPFRTVMQNFTPFINDTTERNYSSSHVPTMSMGALVNCLMRHVVANDGTVTSGFDANGIVDSSQGYHGYIGDGSAKYDFSLLRRIYYGDEHFDNTANAQDVQEITYYLNLDVNGRRIYNILLGLGIKVDLVNFPQLLLNYLETQVIDSDYTDTFGNPFPVLPQPWDLDGTSPFLWASDDSDWQYVKFTPAGQLMPIDLDYNLSFLPFACYCKAYADWFTNSQFEFSINAIEAIIATVEQQKYATSKQIEDLMALCVNVQYASDYFTSALTRPVGKVDSPVSLPDVSFPSDGAVIATDDDDKLSTPYYSGNIFTQYLDTALHRLTDFARRNLLAGVRSVDRWLARWGIHLDSAKVNRSIWLGEYEQQFEISTVTQTSSDDGVGKELGSYAAQMQSSTDRNGHFSFQNSDEFGMIIITSVIVPKVGYFQGMDRHNFHINKLDFLTPEFDAMDVQAIAQYELIAPSLYNPELGAADHDEIFGLTSRYAEYKEIQDCVSGDYFFDSRNTGLDSWHLLRIIDGYQRFQESFTFGNVDSEQYKRIFAITRGGFDPFKMFYNFKVYANLPCHKLFDDYEYDKRGREVELNALGTKIN